MPALTLPDAVRDWIETHFGPVRVVAPVDGGCINPSLRVRLRDGDAFLKYNPHSLPGLFMAEAKGLRALRAASSPLRVPEVLGVQDDPSPPGRGCLLLEWLEPARPGPRFSEELGRGVAQLHRSSGDWGFDDDGFIGSLAQANAPADSWPEFWRARRLEPQLRLVRRAGSNVGTDREWDALWQRLPDLLGPAEAEGPSLLHGDLWHGNVLAAAGAHGAEPALVDPAVYRGHREVDLAMAELFGGFDSGFYAAYRESWPLQPGYVPARRAVYQLYYLLVHVNLFGAGYAQQTERALRQASGKS